MTDHASSSDPAVRAATLRDVARLVQIENTCFSHDRLSRRQFQHLLQRGHADVLVAPAGGDVEGYVAVLYRRGTALARVYSLAVLPGARGSGLARTLMHAAERHAAQRGCASVRLEVGLDNDAARHLYHRLGYRELSRLPHYYEDGTPAMRMEKLLARHGGADLLPVPHYEQSLEFTCGAAALMMAMHAQTGDRGRAPDGSSLELGTTLELRLWREATTVFMAAGHGGCGPYGLALAAWRRGFQVQMLVNDLGVPFLNSVRNADKRHVMCVVDADMRAEAADCGLPVSHDAQPLVALEELVASGFVPIVLISLYRMYREKTPHWVVVCGHDRQMVYVNDPWVDREQGWTALENTALPVPKREFERMARYGRSGLQAIVAVGPPRSDPAPAGGRYRTEQAP